MNEFPWRRRRRVPRRRIPLTFADRMANQCSLDKLIAALLAIRDIRAHRSLLKKSSP
jgi:hypothetical protein